VTGVRTTVGSITIIVGTLGIVADVDIALGMMSRKVFLLHSPDARKTEHGEALSA